MTGVNTRRITLNAFLLSLAGSIGGILLASLNKLGAEYIGKGSDFTGVTAVVLVEVTLAGRRGSMAGCLGSVLVIGLLEGRFHAERRGRGPSGGGEGLALAAPVLAEAFATNPRRAVERPDAGIDGVREGMAPPALSL